MKRFFNRYKHTSLLGLLIVLCILWTVFYYYNVWHVHQSCDGHVVKNIFDWPVCVH